MAQLMPLPLTVPRFSKIQIGFTFLIPAHLGSPRQRAVKRLCVCVCVCLCERERVREMKHFFCFLVSPGNAEAVVKRGGKSCVFSLTILSILFLPKIVKIRLYVSKYSKPRVNFLTLASGSVFLCSSQHINNRTNCN